MTKPATYPPLDTLKPVADNIWIVDGPLIRFGVGFLKAPFPTRMTVIRLPGRRLFIHSPTPLTPALKTEIEAEGTPSWLIAPSRLHYWWLPEWRAAYAGAVAFLAPGVREQAGRRIGFSGRELTARDGYPWDADIATLPIAGRWVTEVEFFHRPTRTLILTDLIENFEADRIGFFTRLLARLGGVLAPHGGMPRDMRLAYRNAPGFAAALREMIAWSPERIILAHGRWHEKDGAAEMRRAFAWALDGGVRR